MNIDTLIIVPARSGSKGIPEKNIRPLAGKPLLAWTAEAIAGANLQASLAILSTDSARYAQIGRNYGLHTPFLRPNEFAADDTAAITVVLHALTWFQAEFDYLPRQLMWLQPTSPFRSAAIINQAMEMLLSRQAYAVVACQEIHRNLSTLFNDDNGFLEALDKNAAQQTSRQQIKPLLTPNGALYLCQTSAFAANRSFYPDKTLPLIMDKVTSLDIDSEEDWAVAEAYIKQGLVV